VTTLDITGVELKSVLENSVKIGGNPGRFLQISGICFSYNRILPAGSRVVSAVRQSATGECNGANVPFTSDAIYKFAANDFITGGLFYCSVLFFVDGWID
jgi:2',3'-cyclic-nucleotide 2'-phosphodiesterase (5'-nucleotidase family)